MPPTERASKPTNPDTLSSLSQEIVDTRGELAETRGELSEVRGHVVRIDAHLGAPAEPPRPGLFEGDPPVPGKPATGLCATMARLAHDNALTRAALLSDSKRRTKITLSASGLALIITALSQFLLAAHSWVPAPPASASSAPQGTHP